MPKVIFESIGKLTGRVIEGIALTPAVSLNHNIYSSEAIDNAKNIGVTLPANWEHTEEIIGEVVYSQGPNHSILYRAEIKTERASELKEGVHKVSIEANIDEVVESCNRKGCYNLIDGITFEGIGITVNPGIQTTTLNIVESYQDWKVINHICEKCKENDCVTYCLQDKAEKGIEIDDQAVAICRSECDITKESDDELKIKVEQLEKQVADLSKPKCTTCGKNKKI